MERKKTLIAAMIFIFTIIGVNYSFSDTTNQCISEVSIIPIGLDDILVVAAHSYYVENGGDCLHNIANFDILEADIYDATIPYPILLINIDLIYYGGDGDFYYFVGMAKYPEGADHAIVYHPEVSGCEIKVDNL